MRDVLIKADWFKGFDKASEEEIDTVAKWLFRYSVLEKDIEIPEEGLDWGIINLLNSVKGNLDRMKNREEKNKLYGETHGKVSGGDPIDIWKYCQEHPKAKAEEVGKALGYAPSAKNQKSGGYGWMYGNIGWLNRKNKDWLKELKQENSKEIPNLENFSKNEEKKENILENFIPTF